MSSYEDKLNDIIKEYNIKINPDDNNYDLILDYLQKIIELLYSELSSTEDEIKLRDSLLRNFYFIKTFLSLVLPYKTFETLNDGKMIANSVNCKFTISDIININDTTDTKQRIFNKIVPYKSQTLIKGKDLLLIDILSAIIFEYIFNINPQYKDFISQYRGCVLSYSKVEDNNEYWDFNLLKNIDSTNSAFNIDNIKKIKKQEDGTMISDTPETFFSGVSFNSESLKSHDDKFKTVESIKSTGVDEKYYDNKVLIVFYDAINNPLSVSDIFEEYIDENIIKVFSSVLDLYNCLQFLGINYGFMHNDLHMGNILFDNNKNKLVLIDFGRSTFGKFKKNSEKEIDDKLKTSFQKLNYEVKLLNNPEDEIDDINTKNIYDSSRKFIRKSHVSIELLEDKYFGIIFDLITFGVNLYLYTLYFNFKNSEEKGKKFKEAFDKIVNITPNNNDIEDYVFNNVQYKIEHLEDKIDILIENYQEVKNKYIEEYDYSREIPNLKEIYIMLLECLFNFALFLIYLNKNYTSNDYDNIIYKYFQIIYKDNLLLLNFKDFINDEIIQKTDRKTKLRELNNSFFSNFIGTSGGKYKSNKKGGLTNQIDRKFILQGKMERLLKYTEPTEITLEETSNKYEKIFNKISTKNMSVSYYTPTKVTIGGNKNKRLLKKRY